MNAARAPTRAETVERVENVTAFVGDGFEPSVVDLEIAAGRIAAIRPAGSRERAAPAGAVIDGTGMLAFPGMVDCHDHLRSLTPGLPVGEGLKLDEFLRVMWSTQREMGPAEYRVGALLGTLQRLKAGMTTVVDHCYTFHAPGLDEASIAGYEGSGVRWLYARGIMTRPYEPVCETWEVAERAIRELVAGGRVSPERMFVAPVSIRQATPDEFRKSRALADDLGCALYTHVAETAAERDAWRTECGASPIHALDDLGFLTDRTVLVHCVLLDDDEIDLLAERAVHVVHCPTNHMKLAKGFTRVPDLLTAGVNVALGIDMMADMLVEMRTEMGMHAAYRLDPNAVDKLDAFRMATRNGARAVGLGEAAGLLEEGKLADLVLLEARSLLQAPLIDPGYALLYATDAGMVRHVVVEGRWVVRDGASTLVDEAALLEEVEDVAEAFLRRIGADRPPWFSRNRDGR
ncbi:MAG: amidohydrolase family protein [Actinomycetota bacterium]